MYREWEGGERKEGRAEGKDKKKVRKKVEGERESRMMESGGNERMRVLASGGNERASTRLCKVEVVKGRQIMRERKRE